MSGSTAGVGKNFADRDRGEFGAEMDDFGGEIGWISWMGSGETWGDARSTRNQANPWIKSNKTSSNQQITEKFGAIFGGDFRNWARTQQNKARKHEEGLQFREKP